MELKSTLLQGRAKIMMIDHVHKKKEEIFIHVSFIVLVSSPPSITHTGKKQLKQPRKLKKEQKGWCPQVR